MENSRVYLGDHSLELLRKIKSGDQPYFDRSRVEPLIISGLVRIGEFGRVVITKSGSQFLDSERPAI
jgi:predicted RNA-binding protein with PUA-like domain